MSNKDFQSPHALSGNYIFNINGNRKLSFGVQSTNVADIILGITTFSTHKKDLYLPSNKLETETLVCQFICSEDMYEWFYIYKWLLKNKNNSSSINSNAYDFMFPCELVALDAHNQPAARFKYTDCFPFTIDALQYTTIDDSEVITFTSVLRYNDFIAIDKDGNEIDIDWNGEL